VFADYRAALTTQQRAEIHTVDENGNHLTKYCANCHTWLPIDLGAFDTPPCQVCALYNVHYWPTPTEEYPLLSRVGQRMI
jgi:hypothetical protein